MAAAQSAEARTQANRAILDAALRDVRPRDVLYSCAGTGGSLFIKPNALILLTPPQAVDPPANDRAANLISSNIVTVPWKQIVLVSYSRTWVSSRRRTQRLLKVVYDPPTGRRTQQVEIDADQARAAFVEIAKHVPPEAIGQASFAGGMSLIYASVGTFIPVLVFFLLVVLGVHSLTALVAAALIGAAGNLLARAIR